MVSKAKRKKEMKAGILGLFAVMFMIGIFVIFLSLIPSMVIQIQTLFSTTSDMAMIVLLGLFVVGLSVVSWLSYEQYKG